MEGDGSKSGGIIKRYFCKYHNFFSCYKIFGPKHDFQKTKMPKKYTKFEKT